jgi:hypothetical protein
MGRKKFSAGLALTSQLLKYSVVHRVVFKIQRKGRQGHGQTNIPLNGLVKVAKFPLAYPFGASVLTTCLLLHVNSGAPHLNTIATTLVRVSMQSLLILIVTQNGSGSIFNLVNVFMQKQNCGNSYVHY